MKSKTKRRKTWSFHIWRGEDIREQDGLDYNPGDLFVLNWPGFNDHTYQAVWGRYRPQGARKAQEATT